MSRSYTYLAGLACSLLLAAAGLAFTTHVASLAGEVVLPVEVMGRAGYTASVEVDVPDAAGVDHLYLQLHRPVYFDAGVNPGRGAKASVKVNGGAWVDITDANVEVVGGAANFGGLTGGFHTVEMRLPAPNVRAGANTIRFRFNGTDGRTSGYRVLALQLERDGRGVVDRGAFRKEDPRTWSAPENSDAARGEVLWSSAQLAVSPLAPDAMLASTCADCHARDGRDLKYFGYSNTSIEERSRFHGLTAQQGRDIAAYIRGVDAPTPAKGRPWNPPYQPNVRLDSRDVDEWAAGAGLSAVLDDDRDILPFLFQDGRSVDDVNATLDIAATLNVRELPVSLQLPDWNAWLPHEHPVDLWGDAFSTSEAVLSYNRVYDAFAADADATVADSSAKYLVAEFVDTTRALVMDESTGPQPCVRFDRNGRRGDVLMTQLPTGKTCEDGFLSVNQWLAVKNWELVHTFGLEDVTPELYERGEPRGWFGRVRSVFEIAPHRSAENSNHFRHQTEAAGAYESNAWYHLQMILNAGHRDGERFKPQDWFYTGNWLAQNARKNDVNLASLFTATHLKMLQNVNIPGADPDGPGRGTEASGGWWTPFVHPWRLDMRLTYGDGFPLSGLDAYGDELRPRVIAAFLGEWIRKTRTYPIATLPRKSQYDGRGGVDWEDAGYVVPTEIPDVEVKGFYSVPGVNFQARDLYRALYRFREIGVDADVRDEIIDWCAEMWPRPENDWDALRGNGPDQVKLTVVGGAGTDWYTRGAEAEVRADVAAGRRFEGWRQAGPGILADAGAARTTFTVGDDGATLTATYTDSLYLLSVEGGTGSGEYAGGASVAIAATVPEGMRFGGWEVTGAGVVADVDAAATTVTTGLGATYAVATFRERDEPAAETYAVTVADGSGSGVYPADSVVAIAAEVYPGERFTHWTLEGPGAIAGDSLAETTFTVGDGDATVTAQYTPILPEGDTAYLVTVVGGEGSGAYAPGVSIDIVAEPAVGQAFTGWVVDGPGRIANLAVARTTFTVGAGNATLTATYADVPTDSAAVRYALTVIGGTGSGDYAAGERVAVAAELAGGTYFSSWRLDGPGELADAKAEATEFVMGAGDATLGVVLDDVRRPLVIRAAGACGSEAMALQVGGRIVATWDSLSTEPRDYLYSGPVNGTLRVLFTNPGGACARALTVAYLEYRGERYRGEDQLTNTGILEDGGRCNRTGTQQSATLGCAGYIEFADAFAAESGAPAPLAILVAPNPAVTGAEAELSFAKLNGQVRELVISDITGTERLRVPVGGQVRYVVDTGELGPGVFYVTAMGGRPLAAVRLMVL